MALTDAPPVVDENQSISIYGPHLSDSETASLERSDIKERIKMRAQEMKTAIKTSQVDPNINSIDDPRERRKAVQTLLISKAVVKIVSIISGAITGLSWIFSIAGA